MTQRDEFAKAALTGLLGNSEWLVSRTRECVELVTKGNTQNPSAEDVTRLFMAGVAKDAYAYADAMLKESTKEI